MNAAYLVLENGKVFRGSYLGHEGETIGEIVFTTGMTGYLETLTDPSYYGQIVVQTFPSIGNYGVIPSDFESSKVGPSGYIVKEWCQAPSNFRSEGDIDAFFKSKKIVGLCGIDTRTLTKIIRENGVMNGKIMRDPDGVDMEEIRNYAIKDAVARVSCDKKHVCKAENSKYKVALLDFGGKESTVQGIVGRGGTVTVWPYNASPAEILDGKPNGIVLSDGPGNPAENAEIIANLKVLLKANIPIFGIGLGHQLLALANGFRTEKLKHGHRGANQPVKEIETGRVHITGQNHGYVVVSDSVKSSVAQECFVNVNDGTNEGFIYKNRPDFSVQFHPEDFLFERFAGLMDSK